MTRMKKYALDRKQIELENSVQELIDYINERTFIEMFDDPLGQINRLLDLPRVNGEDHE